MKIKISDILSGIVLAVFIMTSAIVISLNFRPLYYFMSEKLSIPAMAGFTEEDARNDYDTLISYNSIFGPDTLEFENTPQSEEGRIHFYEVKRIFVSIEIAMYLCLLGTIALTAMNIKMKRFTYLKIGGLIAVILPIAVGIPAVLFWEETFTMFHKIAFSNDYWMMNPYTDPVVLILPQEYFAACTGLIAGLIIIMSTVSVVLSIKLNKKREK